MIKTHIIDGGGSKESAFVEDNALVVSQYGCPPMIPQKNKIFRQYFTVDGTTAGSNDMLVDGSGTSIEFWVPADTNDIYITDVSFVLGDAGANLNEFCGIAALTNGCDFEYYRDGEIVTIHGALKSNWDFIRMCRLNPPFGDAASAFRLTNVEGGAEAYAPVFDFLTIMPPYGLKLDAGTTQRLVIRVNDKCDVPDVFNAIAYGFERFE